jgi:hypothetical protein
MNNNDTNNLGNNGLNPTNLGENTPSTMNPVNGGMEQLGSMNSVNTNNNIQSENLGNTIGNLNGTPEMVTPVSPSVETPVNQGVNLLNPNPNMTPTPVQPNINMVPNQPQDMTNMTIGTMADNSVSSSTTPENVLENMNPISQGESVSPNGFQPVNSGVSMNPNPNMNPISQEVPVSPNGFQPVNSGVSMNPNPNMNPISQGDSVSPNGFQPVNSEVSMNLNTNMNPNLNNPMGINSINNSPSTEGTMGNMNMAQPNMTGDNPFIQPNMGMNPNMNNNVFGAVPTPPMGNMGNGTNKKKKLKFTKTTIIIIVVLVIAIIGCAIYLILNNATSTQTKGNISTKDLFLELGKPLSTEISDYAVITGFNVSTCTVDTSNVNTKRMGSYEYTVSCGSTTQKGSIVLRDQTAPVVVVKELMVAPGTLVSLEDFIVSCDDYTKCSYELEDANQSLETLVQTVGDYKLNLIVSDDYDNKETVELSLVVSDSAPVRYMYCTPTSTQDDDLKATLELSYNYGINMDDVLVKTEKTYVYTFDEEEDYLKVKDSYSETTGINGILGQTLFDDENFTITIFVNMTDTDLGTEFNMNPFPTDYEGLRQFNIEQGITCKNR